MTTKTKAPKAAGLQTKKGRRTKPEIAYTLSGIDRVTFDSLWSRLPGGVKNKCSAAELAQLAGMLHSLETREKPVNPVKNPVSRAKNALVRAQDRFKRAWARVPALPLPGDIKPALQSALTSLAVRLPWGRK